MFNILITGSNGFIGKNLCCHLRQNKHYSLTEIDFPYTKQQLIDGLKKADLIIHLAGVNRPATEKEFFTGNVDFTVQLLEYLNKLSKSIPIIASSSTKALLNTPYGLSKKKMEEILLNWAAQTNTKVFLYRLTNVFGKWCRPNYNSVVATFCHHIAHQLPITINEPHGEVCLVYVDDVINSFLTTIEHLDSLATGFIDIPQSYTITLEDLALKIKTFSNNISSLCMPDLTSPFDKALYATYLSYLEKDQLSYPLTINQDQRGLLSEFIKSASFGQIFISVTKPNITRGNHWHHTKTEKFLVLQGSALITLRSILNDTKIEFKVSQDQFEVIDIPPGYTHAITNTGHTDLITLFWASEIFNPLHPDTYYEEV